MLEILGWIVFGLIIGLIARALYPGTQKLGIPNTIALGIAGSILGGLISWAWQGRPPGGAWQGSGVILSIVGALIVVWVAMAMKGRRA
jgi:uncharacterized membrane protein YeaQ/YmgE (transglycosylase-associated protein family)